MNPINLFGNPQQFLKQMMGNNQVMNNPMAKNALDMARRGYTEARDTHKDKDTKMHELESYMTELGKDVSDLISGMSPEERTLAKSKLATLINKM